MKNFVLVSESYDIGEFVTAIKVEKDDFSAKDVVVTALFTETEYVQKVTESRLITRQVQDIETKGNYTYINLKFAPSEKYLDHRVFVNATENYHLTIKGQEYMCAGIENPLVDAFKDVKTDFLNYRLFKPQSQNPAPLVVWLHGIGEIGYENRLQIANAFVVSWSFKGNQKIFGENGAYIAVPQVRENAHSPELIKKMIDEIILKNNIDQSRIYIGGCSMGGHGVNQVIENYPNLFAAAFPVCPASAVSEETAQTLAEAKMPVYCIHCKDDPACSEVHSMLTVNRINKAGGNANLALFDKIEIDGIQTGAHAVWVYVHQNFSGDSQSSSGKNFHNGMYEASNLFSYYKGIELNFFDLYGTDHVFDKQDISTWKKFRGEDMDNTLVTQKELKVSCKSTSPKDLGYANFFDWLKEQQKA